jgi:hypothetical protein
VTVGELFIRLGFKIDGDKELATVERSMGRATGSATKLALEVAALSAGFLYMIETSMKAAVLLRNFALSTNLSTDELQMWQHAAVVNGLTANDLTESIKELQTQRSQFALGNPQAVGAWTLLGVDPRQDPFEVLKKLRTNLLQVKDVGVARNLLGQVGLENMLPLLRSTNVEWERWSQNFIVTKKQTEALVGLNAAWQSLKLSIESVKTQFAVIFAPVLGGIARFLEIMADKMAIVVRWLQSGSPLAHFFSTLLQILAVAVLALGVALTGLVAVLGTLTAVIGFVASGVGTLLLEFAPFILILGAIGVAAVGLALLLNDLWVNVKGGKSFFDWAHSSFMEIRALEMGLKNVLTVWNLLTAGFKAGEGVFEKMFSHLPNWALAIPSGANTSNSSRHENNTEINIHEAVSARSTGREVQRSMAEVNRAAITQAPVRSY